MIVHSKIVRILREYRIEKRKTGEEVTPGSLASRIVESLGEERSLPTCLLNQEGVRCEKETGILEVIVLSEDPYHLIKR